MASICRTIDHQRQGTDGSAFREAPSDDLGQWYYVITSHHATSQPASAAARPDLVVRDKAGGTGPAMSTDPARIPVTLLVLHAAQHVFHPTVQLRAWPPNHERRSRIVFIVRELSRKVIEESLTAVLDAACAPERSTGT
jgi:hypothetical protein